MKEYVGKIAKLYINCDNSFLEKYSYLLCKIVMSFFLCTHIDAKGLTLIGNEVTPSSSLSNHLNILLASGYC
jgi:hypothetical protein